MPGAASRRPVQDPRLYLASDGTGCACAHPPRRLRAPIGLSTPPAPPPGVVAVTSDGRRVQVPVDDAGASVLSLLRSILVGIEEVVLLITGGRREHGGTRRSDRS